MSKQTPNQIRENTRKEVAKQYRERIKNLLATIKEKDEEIHRLRDLYHNAATELCELKSKREMQEEWIERMQDFCNMNDEDRQEFIEQQRTNFRLEKQIDSMMGTYSRLFSLY